MSETSTMLEDDRAITAISSEDHNYSVGHRAGSGVCTKIEVYGEPAEFCYVPWLAVYCGDEIYARVPAWMVAVYYKVA